MTEKIKSRKDYVTFLEWLALMFIYLKLTGSIEWSWAVVLMPIWLIPVSLVITGFIMGMLGIKFNKKGE